jgi:hypothetical protein
VDDAHRIGSHAKRRNHRLELRVRKNRWNLLPTTSRHDDQGLRLRRVELNDVTIPDSMLRNRTVGYERARLQLRSSLKETAQRGILSVTNHCNRSQQAVAYSSWPMPSQ